MQKHTVKVKKILIRKLKEGVVFSKNKIFHDARLYVRPENPNSLLVYPRPQYAVPVV